VGGNPAFPFCQDVTVADYYSALVEFAPEPGAPREWAALARDAGMSYAVLTTKHHDGFCMFPWRGDGALSVAQLGIGRDLVAEFVDACRAEGLRVGFYYSLSDWHHPDYPAFTDAMRPYPMIAYPRPEPERWARYLDTMRGHLDHLLTRYGPIDVLWFDGGWERSAPEWDAAGIEAFIRARQPEIVLNDRLPGVGDYRTPEQSVPPDTPAAPWETCLTMGHSWGNTPGDDAEHKSATELVRTLARVAARGGNLLLNISPDGAGHIPGWQRERLDAIGAWMRRNRDAVLGTTAGIETWRFDGPTTRRGSTIHVLCPYRPIDSVELRAVPVRRVRRIRNVASGRDLVWQARVDAVNEILSSDPPGDLVIEVPEGEIDPICTAIAIDFE
jgi:alpha-L-fucosidase